MKEADASECDRIVAACLDRGIFTFDCADVYSSGEAEKALGALLRPRRRDVVVTTKVYFPTGQGPNDCGASRRHLVASIEASLARLGLECIDILFVHRFDEHTELEETIATLGTMVDRGLVQYVGVSNFAAWQAQKAHMLLKATNACRLACVQPMFSLLKRQCETEILPQARDCGAGVMVYSPLAAGLLTGKYRDSGADQLSRMNHNAVYQRRYGEPETQVRLASYLEWCGKRGLDPTHVALAWAARHPMVTAPILGARSAAQLNQQLGFLDLKFDDDQLVELDRIFPPPPRATDRREETA